MTEKTSQSNQDSSLVARHSSLSLEEARVLVASRLWPRIRAFLWDFASLCDPARLAGSFVTRHSSLVTAEGLLGSPRVARAAEKALGLTPFFHLFPADDSSRLLLLSREDYDSLAQFLGTVALAPALRRITLGAEVRALKAALPGYSATLAFTAYFRRHEPLFEQLVPAGEAANPAVVFSSGHSILALALSTLPSELLLRHRLRFPEGSPADTALQAAQASPDGQAPFCPIRTTSESHSSLAGEARAASILALKLSNPSEYNTLCS